MMQSASFAPKNRFTSSEWSGALGDLGTLLPIAFALVVFNGFAPQRLFFLWGLVYVITGLVFRVPVAVQPLKAMAVIAISAGIDASMLSGAAVWYGLLLVFLTLTGLISRLQKLFSAGMVRGIQLGVGLILARKAIELATKNGLFLHLPQVFSAGSAVLMILITLALAFAMRRGKLTVLPLFIVLGIVAGFFFGSPAEIPTAKTPLISLHLPDIALVGNCFILLIVPQLPLTLGNAVYAAADSCHTLWGPQACRVTAPRFSLSIGISDILIGLAGGFPICHGSGGIGAHAQFGGKTGGTTVILGVLMILMALHPAGAGFLFLIPVPLLSSMLLFDSWRMMKLIEKLEGRWTLLVAIIVGGVSFLSRNLTLALVVGVLIEQVPQMQKSLVTQFRAKEKKI